MVTRNTIALISLLSAAIMSALIYLFAFVYPYNIFELYPYPRLAVYRFAQDDPLVIWRLSLLFVILCGLYFMGWRAARLATGKMAWGIVLGGTLISSAILLFLYPFDAADVFDYIMHGRILTVHSGNPLQDVAEQFPDDPFYAYIAWGRVPSFYGPAWELVGAGTTWLAGNRIIANVLAFKLVNGIFFAASIGLVILILRQVASDRLLAGVTFLAWNPVILYETLGHGHNDITIVCSMLAAVLAIIHRRYTLAILALTLGGLFKFIPFLLIPAAGLIALRNLSNFRTQVKFLIVTALVTLGLISLAYWPFWYGIEILDLGRRTQLFTASLPAFFYTWLLPTLGREQAASIVSFTAVSLTILFTLWQSGRIWGNPSWLNFTQITTNILLFYLLLTCSWFQQWYSVWPLGIAALLPSGPIVYLTLVLGGYTVLSKHIIFGPLFFRLAPLPRAWREIWFGPTVLGLPWLFALFALLDTFTRKLIGRKI